MSAIDLATRITPSMIPAMKAAGIEAVCRYLSNSPAKNLSADEAKLLSAAGIKCVVVWEAQGDKYASFTAAQGAIDAGRAIAEAHSLGMPAGACIYFCGDDFDASDAQIAGGITQYMKPASALVHTAGFTVGVYGNGACCKAMLDGGMADKAWLWGVRMSNGTPAFTASGRWSIRQHPTINEFGASVDPDDVQGDYGGWLLGDAPRPIVPAVPAAAPAAGPALPASPGPDQIKAILTATDFQAAVRAFQISRDLTADGVIGPNTLRALTGHP